MFRSDLENTTVCTFRYHGIAIGQALGRTDVAAVKLVIVCQFLKTGLNGCIFPNHLKCHRVKFQYPGKIPQCVVKPGNRTRIRSTISSPPSIIKNQDISLAWKPFRYHVGMMLTDDLAQFP